MVKHTFQNMELNQIFRHTLRVMALCLFALHAGAQVTFPENGVVDPRTGHYAFTNATIVKDAGTTLKNATMVIRDGRIVAIGSGIRVPAGAVVVDCSNRFIYPSLGDI